jgi:iron complex outermembrane receptor protein
MYLLRHSQPVSSTLTVRFAAVVLGVLVALTAHAVTESPAQLLAKLSLEELSDLQVTSVSKSAESLRLAPAAIYVITHEEILRSGVTSIAEALRLAPNLQITQYSATNYIAGARGLAGAQEAQNFSNKLLILIDGRSVYTPLYSGVYLDVQDVLLDDIDRIEVISGPGATLWGANAMHGVINVITRPAQLTDQSLLKVGIGNLERIAGARYGAKVNDELSFRVYGKAFKRDAMELADGADAGDDWHKGQGGFRLDWERSMDTVTVQGDAYSGTQHQLSAGDVDIKGANVLGRWQHRTERSEWQLQSYYDQTERAQPLGGVAFILRTVDVELQQQFNTGSHRLVWGAGGRMHRYRISNSASLLFDPDARTLTQINLFAQDTVSLSKTIDLMLGLKLERDSFSGWNPLPDVRLTWRLGDNHLVWASASRAIRSPTPFDIDVIERIGTVDFLVGNKSFEPEQVDAYELGYRANFSDQFSISALAFYNVYDDLRTIEPASTTVFLPLKWDNLMEGEISGVEAWAKWQMTDSWRLSPGIRHLNKRLEFKSDASALLGLEQSGNDPEFQALLTSALDIGAFLSLETTLRYVDELPNPQLDAYYELSASLLWNALPNLDVSVSGFNLLNDSHQEYPSPSGEYIRRSVIAEARWRF